MRHILCRCTKRHEQKVSDPRRPVFHRNGNGTKQANQTESSQKSFLERVRGLSGYTLSDNEYHIALMFLFHFKSAPEEFTAKYLDNLLHEKNSYFESRIAETSARNLYTQAQKHFASELGRERRQTGYNDAAEVASYTEKGSAASLLLLFRQNDTDRILWKTPNPTNIHIVKFDQVVKEPGEDYVRFLMDWHNSVRH